MGSFRLAVKKKVHLPDFSTTIASNVAFPPSSSSNLLLLSSSLPYPFLHPTPFKPSCSSLTSVNMSDEVFDGAIGIDLGASLRSPPLFVAR